MRHGISKIAFYYFLQSGYVFTTKSEFEIIKNRMNYDNYVMQLSTLKLKHFELESIELQEIY
ncbi:unnamed protein product (macronuclear) [Paramecium tetraurelia]|uniref:Uncharacterized protein n=1 Tax=Paramecium tetraurelia TaxID=5888 RepID=A0DUB3_PARTE|nr:uncharacterized protein GSPATT00020302001 [Paramecium tetraurelia]CAK86630.1 unnamed protein product [Paramecium tetraurelia]|eukprot:XP_001454027.1 hypothetical protein (macronuclear) [Paramecium tetraurelia strain d4-2]